MKNNTVITNFCSFTNDNTHAVINEHTPPNSRAGMDFDTGKPPTDV